MYHEDFLQNVGYCRNIWTGLDGVYLLDNTQGAVDIV